MSMKYIMTDIKTLRSIMLQELLKMVIRDDWQSEVYRRIKEQVENNPKHRANYMPTYERIRDMGGIENYSIDQMDVSFIYVLLKYHSDIAPTSGIIMEAVERVKDDRNIIGHSHDNEKDEELFQQGMIELFNLKELITAVDKNKNISDENRKAYRAKHTKQIEKLRGLLIEESTFPIKQEKEVEQDVQKILECDDEEKRAKVWRDLERTYFDRYFKQGNMEAYFNFVIHASDSGVKEAHVSAATYYLDIKKDYAEGERRLIMSYEAHDSFYDYEAKEIVDAIRMYMMQGNDITAGMSNIVDLLIKRGYPVKRDETGTPHWDKRKK